MRQLPLLFLIILYACSPMPEQQNIAKELKGNSYNLYSIDQQDTMVVDFKDSTYSFVSFGRKESPWRLSSVEGNQILLIEHMAIALKPNGLERYTGLVMSNEHGFQDHEILFEKRPIRWEKENLFGKWEVLFSNDDPEQDGSLKPPPPPPPAPPGMAPKEIVWPPFYEISEKKITSNFNYSTYSSTLYISGTNDFFSFGYGNSEDKIGRLWEIKSLSDSIVVVHQRLHKYPDKIIRLRKLNQ